MLAGGSTDTPDPPPVERREDIHRQQQNLFAGGEILNRLLNAIPVPILIINGSWQVVFANRAALQLAKPGSGNQPVGLREGEPFHCIHTQAGKNGMERAEYCRLCDVASAVSGALLGRETVSDCRLTCDLAGRDSTLDLRVWSSPLRAGGEQFSLLVMGDISHEKRRNFLANVCFHDLLNTLTSIRGLLDVLKHSEVEERPEICEQLEQTTLNSIDEIAALRLLEQAEDGELPVVWEPVSTGELLSQIAGCLRHHPAAKGKQLVLAAGSADLVCTTDRTLLRRTIENMVLNALEATDEGGSVRASCRREGPGVEFWVHNDRPMPPKAQMEVFRRSFSTKGVNRGLGTYSIKLLSTALQGKASFSTSQESGTTFRILLPTEPSRPG